MKPMFEASVAPILKKEAGQSYIRRRKLSTFGLTESGVDEIAAPIYSRYKNPETTILADRGVIELHLAARARSEREGDELLTEVCDQLEEALGHHVFSSHGETLEEVVGEWLRFRGNTLAVAESCTGGMLAARITDVPGSSDYFIEGVVTYSNEAKIRILGVDRHLIRDHGAVSSEVAEAMADGVRRLAGTSFGVGITGVAGPGGGTEDKPVGLVYIGLAEDAGTSSRRYLFPGDRYLIRNFSVNAALDMVRRRIR